MSEQNTLCFATHNKNKLREVSSLLTAYQVVGLEALGCMEDIPETGQTLEENSWIKAKYVAEKYGVACFADDTGLEVSGLNGAPGVYSARYAGTQKSDVDNMRLLLKNLADIPNKKARFRTVITLIQAEEIHRFEGVVNGSIIKTPQGQAGFGYDPIFMPEGCDKTFSQMTKHEKNEISHRGKAIEKLARFLRLQACI